MGYKILLTADRCLMAKYDLLCLGSAADFPIGTIPDFIMFKWVLPKLPKDKSGKVIFAPYCLRKIESLLLTKFDEDEVAIVNPDEIHKFINEDTKIVAISTVDPMGIGPPVTTFCTLLKGEIGPITYIAREFRKLMYKLKKLKKKHKFKIIVGGPGAWEIANEDLMNEFSIDYILIGEAEEDLPEIFEKILNNEKLPRIITMKPARIESFKPIRKPSISGLVEITRGCGRGCKFCAPTVRPFRSIPLDVIIEEIKINLPYWKTIHLVTEDFLRYGSTTFEVNKDAVLRLVHTLRSIGVQKISPLHVTLATVVQAPDLIHEISEVFDVDIEKGNYIGTQIGIETASPKLMDYYMKGKVKPYTPDKWPEIIENACKILHENSWVIMGTLLVGLPNETDDDIYMTIELMDRLKDLNIIWVPCFFTPLGPTPLGNSKPLTRDRMRKSHWELLATCCRYNAKMIERFAENYFKTSKMNFIKRYVYLRGLKLMKKAFEEIDREIRNGQIPPPILSGDIKTFYKILFSVKD